jgi:hypothetical protein
MEEMICFACPRCQHELEKPPSLAAPGDILECPSCRGSVTVPRPKNSFIKQSIRRVAIASLVFVTLASWFTPLGIFLATREISVQGKSEITVSIAKNEAITKFVQEVSKLFVSN